MATITVGDFHGNLEALTDILDQVHGEGGRQSGRYEMLNSDV
jgi:hypothetical protein